MTDPVEGELLPAVRRTSDPAPVHGPTVRHGCCHHVVRAALPPWRAFCGALVRSLAETRRQDLQKCPECLAASADHALHCDCWKLHPTARLPR